MMIDALTIDTVTFDLWNTLIAHDEFYDDNIRRFRIDGIADALVQKGLPITKADVERAYLLSDGRLAERWSTDRDMDVEEQLSLFLCCMGVEPSEELIKAIDSPYTDAVLKVKPFLVEGAREAILDMKERGCQVALISNTGRTPGKSMRKVMEGFDLLDLFDEVTFSNEVGYLKPHPKIFEDTLSLLSARPERAVHIGDHAVLDVLGAKKAGMRSVHVTQYALKGDCRYTADVRIERISELSAAIERLAK